MQSKRLLTEEAVYNMTIFSGIQYVVLTIIAMFLYSGSTHRNMDTVGYVFTENFLSDLGRINTFDGTSNLVCAGIYFWVLLCVGASAILFFTILRYIFRKKSWTKYLSYLMAMTGIFAGVGLVGIGCAPADLIHDIHIFFVYWSFVFLLLSLLLLMICIYGTPGYPKVYGHLLLLTNLILAGYVGLLFYGPNPYTSDDGLMIQVVGQKIIVYLLIISLAIQAIGAKKVWKGMTA